MTISVNSNISPDQNIPSILITTPLWSRRFKLNRDIITIGHDVANDIVIENPIVSGDHALIRRSPRGFTIEDLSSTAGLIYKSQRTYKKILVPGDQFWIGQYISLTYEATFRYESEYKSRKLDIGGRKSLTIGRSTENDVVLDDPAVSKLHARIELHTDDSKYWIQDLRTTNGTFVNGERLVKQRVLVLGDIVNIGSTRFDFYERQLRESDEHFSIRLDAIDLEQQITPHINLLKGVSLSVMPGEFVAIVGGSGTGKSTLIQALNGSKPATAGQVLINGRDLYRNFDVFKTQLGYIPQEDIIHKELTVYEVLNYSAMLRLPGDTTTEERHIRIGEVIRTLNLSDRSDTVVGKLSGGERKRVSIGVELLIKPGLFFLDEATSGLDPGMELSLMQMLRKLSDHGHTVILITHATRNIALCDQVAFLAYGGHLAYYGPPNDALQFFKVKEFDEIYSRLQMSPVDHQQVENEGTKTKISEEWASIYQKSGQFQENIINRHVRYAASDKDSMKLNKLQGIKWRGRQRASDLSQFITLLRRNGSILMRDKATLLLMLLISPIVGLFCAPFWRYDLFSTTDGDAELAITNLFIVSIVCCITGAVASMREIVKETDIYQRERMVALRILPYILSKVSIFLVLSLYQAGIFLLMLKIFGNWPDSVAIVWQVYSILFLATLGGAMQGLLISAISPNQNAAPQLLIIVIVLQLVFGGIIPTRDQPVLKTMNNVFGTITTTKWTFESMVTVSGTGAAINEDPCWQKTSTQKIKMDDDYTVANCNCTGVNIFSTCKFPGIMKYYDPAIDTAEPLKPDKPIQPAPPPKKPAEPAAKNQSGSYYDQFDGDYGKYQKDIKEWAKQMEDYTKKVDSYEQDMKRYEEKVELYTEDYKKWRSARETAIGKAEGLINSVNENYGHAFKVNLSTNRLAVIFFIIVILFALLLRQKLKDGRYPN